MSLQENIHEESRHKDRSKRKLKQNRQKIDDKTIGKILLFIIRVVHVCLWES